MIFMLVGGVYGDVKMSVLCVWVVVLFLSLVVYCVVLVVCVVVFYLVGVMCSCRMDSLRLLVRLVLNSVFRWLLVILL